MLLGVLMLSACHFDEEIDTSKLEGNWFATRIEMTDAASLDDVTYQINNSRTYNETALTDGGLLFMVSGTTNFNEYNVSLFKYVSGNWAIQQQQLIKLSSANKFKFFGRECKLKNNRESTVEVKVSHNSDIYRYTLKRTSLTK